MVTSKGRYAMRVMLDLAGHNDGSYQPLADIAVRQGISEKYLESIMLPLGKAGLVEALRGKGGGYRLTREPDGYTVGEILSAVERTLKPVSCLETMGGGCDRPGGCASLPVWRRLGRLIDDYLGSVTLLDVLEGRDEHPAPQEGSRDHIQTTK